MKQPPKNFSHPSEMVPRGEVKGSFGPGTNTVYAGSSKLGCDSLNGTRSMWHWPDGQETAIGPDPFTFKQFWKKD